MCAGDDATLTCNSSNGRIRWIFIFPESVELHPITRQISSTKVAATEEIFPITLNQTVTVFHMQRRSDYNTTPLVSSIFIENVSAGINIPKSDSEDKQFMILVIDGNHGHGKWSQLKHNNYSVQTPGTNQIINVSKTLEFHGIDILSASMLVMYI